VVAVTAVNVTPAHLPVLFTVRQGKVERQLIEERHGLWLKAIARDYLMETKLKYERVRFRRFVNGRYKDTG